MTYPGPTPASPSARDGLQTTDLHLTVPLGQVSRLLQVYASCWEDAIAGHHSDSGESRPLAESAADRPHSAKDPDGQVSFAALHSAGPGLTPDAVSRAYRGGSSDYWRPFLRLLARQPASWVAWSELHTSLGLSDRQCAGMIGAAERRCKGLPPYVKSYDDGRYWFYMPGAVADVINSLSAREESAL